MKNWTAGSDREINRNAGVAVPKFWPRARAAGVAAMIGVAVLGGAARADDADPSTWRELETKYLFGFTSGSGIGKEGEKEIAVVSVGRFGKRDGSYASSETLTEFEYTPTQFIQIEFGALVSSHAISGVTGLTDRNQIALSGAVVEVRYLAIERTASWPLSVTLSLEPSWRRYSSNSGDPESSFEVEFKLNADLELVKNRLYAGFNMLYEPEYTRTPMGEIERESKLGLSGALAVRLMPNVVVGAEGWYLRHHDSLTFAGFTGDAVFVGPTLYVKLSKKAAISAAWNTQVWGREAGAGPNLGSLNLADFQRHRARLRLGVEF
jgi:hypothetical protein